MRKHWYIITHQHLFSAFALMRYSGFTADDMQDYRLDDIQFLTELILMSGFAAN